MFGAFFAGSGLDHIECSLMSYNMLLVLRLHKKVDLLVGPDLVRHPELDWN